jgi:hypothetical protein
VNPIQHAKIFRQKALVAGHFRKTKAMKKNETLKASRGNLFLEEKFNIFVVN